LLLLAALGSAVRGADGGVSLAPAAKIDPWLSNRLAVRGSERFLVIFGGPGEAGEEGAAAVYDRLRARARSAQADTRRWLDARGIPWRTLYIVNALAVEGDLDLARALSERGEVARIVGDPVVRAIEPEAEQDSLAPAGIEWNVSAVHADTVWTSDGVRGEGIVVASADSGVEWSHPALKAKYRGWDGTTASHDFNWHDAIADTTTPFDDLNHGTHTVGTMVGDDGGANQIGVAPGAKWIACKNMNVGNGSPSSYLECLQFFLAPYPHGGDPETDGVPSLAPQVVNNSWYCPPSEGCDNATLLDAFAALRSAGILSVGAVGNHGPACSSAAYPPEFYADALSVGATMSSLALASYSARGPVTADASNRLKPELSAPGSGVRSSIPGSTYSLMSGTSMASPHVAGAAALLWSARPGLRGRIDITRCLLTRGTSFTITTTPGETCGGTSGAVRPNNLFGWGLLDASNAIHLGPDPDADGIGDTCDCAPSDGGAFDVPGEVTGEAFAADHKTLSWPSWAGAAGTGTVYDVVRGDVFDLRAAGSIAGASCVGVGLSAPTFTNAQLPAAGRAFYYVVQARNACGAGGWGADSTGASRVHASCP
jgi:subtilisin family serine protease